MSDIHDIGCGYVLFFKQKTAYEMRISDWSSDVCSSDLSLTSKNRAGKPRVESLLSDRSWPRAAFGVGRLTTRSGHSLQRLASRFRTFEMEEHTSELQSLMRISYAVFCLKKKTNTQNKQIPQPINSLTLYKILTHA